MTDDERYYVLRKTWNQWSPGTRVDYIEDAEKDSKGYVVSALVRIRGEQTVVPMDHLVLRRSRSSVVVIPSPLDNDDRI